MKKFTKIQRSKLLLSVLLTLAIVVPSSAWAFHQLKSQPPQQIRAVSDSTAIGAQGIATGPHKPKPRSTTKPKPKPVTKPPTKKVTLAPKTTTRQASAPAKVAEATGKPRKLSLVPSTPAPKAPTAPPTSGQPQWTNPNPSTNYLSTNWSGYASIGAHYTSVSGSWIVLNPTRNGSGTSADATWVGIGGVTTGDLIQAGSINIIDANGNLYSSLFYETLPAAATAVGSVLVKPGDSITTSISETSKNLWRITITNNTTSQTFTTSLSYTSQYNSAEWIQETPTDTNGNLMPLDFYGSVNLINCLTTMNGVSQPIGSTSPSNIKMIKSQSMGTLSSASALSGSNFTATRSALP